MGRYDKTRALQVQVTKLRLKKVQMYLDELDEKRLEHMRRHVAKARKYIYNLYSQKRTKLNKERDQLQRMLVLYHPL